LPDIAGDARCQRGAASLRGLSGVLVLVQDLSPRIEEAGLTKSELQADVEQRLRWAGIRVLGREEWRGTTGWPVLYVQVSLHTPHKVDIFSLYIHVQLFEHVALERDPTIKIPALTWAPTAYVGTSGKRYLKRGIQHQVRDQVDQFIAAYRSANPK